MFSAERLQALEDMGMLEEPESKSEVFVISWVGISDADEFDSKDEKENPIQ